MTAQNHIEGVFRLTTPMHVASTEPAPATKNITLTMTQPVVSRGGLEYVPYYPGNGFRGGLRRHAGKLVIDVLTNGGVGKVSQALYSGLMAGAISAQPDSAQLTVEEAIRGRNHVYMGLFGGGARLLESSYRVNDLIPIIGPTIEAGMVASQLGEASDTGWTPVRHTANGPVQVRSRDLLHEPHFLRVDDVQRALNPGDIVQYIENATLTVASYQASTIEARSNRKQTKKDAEAAKGSGERIEVAKKTDIGNISSLQAIAAGTPMYFRLDFTDTLTDAQLGLLSYALLAVVKEQRLGGFGRAGFGRFKADLVLTRHGERSTFLANAAGEESYELAGEALRCQQAMRTELQSLTAASLESFFRNRADSSSENKQAA